MVRVVRTPSRSRDAFAPGFCGERSALLDKRACGTPGADAPAASCAVSRKHTSSTPRSHRETPGVPHAMVLRLMACSPRRPIAFGRRRALLRVSEPRSRPALRRGLMPRAASRPHVFAVRDSVVASASEGSLTDPLQVPALKPHSRLTLPASTASHPAVVTIANAPLTEAGQGEYNHRNSIRSSGAREEFPSSFRGARRGMTGAMARSPLPGNAADNRQCTLSTVSRPTRPERQTNSLTCDLTIDRSGV